MLPHYTSNKPAWPTTGRQFGHEELALGKVLLEVKNAEPYAHYLAHYLAHLFR